MKIAGIKVGGERGELIELSHQRKLEEALKAEVPKLPETRTDFAGKMTWARNIKISEFSFTSKGMPLKGKWQNNLYRGKGTLEVHLRDSATDRVLSPKKMEFDVTFEDTIDSWGMPDLLVSRLDLV